MKIGAGLKTLLLGGLLFLAACGDSDSVGAGGDWGESLLPSADSTATVKPETSTGYVCETRPLADSSGLVLVCGGDSIGVLLNGAQGLQGIQGAAGVGCKVVTSTQDSVTIACGEDVLQIPLTGGSAMEQDLLKNLFIGGFSQKGPFVKGAMVVAYELANGKSLTQTGRMYSGEIISDDGLFNISSVNLVSQYAMIRATGFYKNEVSGKSSTSAITLNAVTDLGDRSTVNVNLLTHLEYYRVKELVKNGDMTVGKAKIKAEEELFKAFYINSSEFGSTEDLNIFSKGDGNAALLAISVLMLRNNNDADFTDDLTQVASDLGEDGLWNDAKIRAKVADWADSVDLNQKLVGIRENVEGFNLGDVPDFEKYFRNFWYQEYGLGECGPQNADVVKNDTASNSRLFASKYANNGDSDLKVRFICSDKDSTGNKNAGDAYLWRVATDIEKDTAGWGHEFSNGAVRRGQVELGRTYVYENGNWRYGTTLDSLFKVGGFACIVGRDTSKADDGKYYYCRENESAAANEAVREWAYAGDLYNDTYESRAECSDLGKYGDGTILAGRLDSKKSYVCDEGEFRAASARERYVKQGCSSFNEGATNFASDTSDYICREGAWVVYKMDLEYQGQTYKTVRIGEQVWFAENLNYVPEEYADLDELVSCYDEDDEYCEKYGHLYTWSVAVDSLGVLNDKAKGCGNEIECGVEPPIRGLCPEGWHLPSTEEWEILNEFVYGDDAALRSIGWDEGTDLYGFSGLPSGYRRYYAGNWFDKGSSAYWWAATEDGLEDAENWYLDYSSTGEDYNYKDMGLSIRCLKD